MKPAFNGLIAIVLGGVVLGACALGRKDMERLTLGGGGDGAGAGAGGSGASPAAGQGGSFGPSSAGDGGTSGQTSGGAGGASGQGTDGGDAPSDAGDDRDGSAPGTGGSGGSPSTGGSGGSPSTGGSGGGTTSGLADCTHDSAQAHGDHEYYFCSNYMSWTQARDICADGGGSLVVIDDADENAFLTEHFGPHPSWWIGANDETMPDTWRWVDGASNDGASLCTGKSPCSPAGGSYANFATGEPNAISTEGCAAIGSAGTWADEYCIVSKPFICEQS